MSAAQYWDPKCNLARQRFEPRGSHSPRCMRTFWSSEKPCEGQSLERTIEYSISKEFNEKFWKCLDHELFGSWTWYKIWGPSETVSLNGASDCTNTSGTLELLGGSRSQSVSDKWIKQYLLITIMWSTLYEGLKEVSCLDWFAKHFLLRNHPTLPLPISRSPTCRPSWMRVPCERIWRQWNVNAKRQSNEVPCSD